MAGCGDFEITSIGARCFNRWFLCGRCGLRYVSSPLDNMDNAGPNGLANVLSLIRGGFSQIREDALERSVARNGVSLETGETREYRGYDYTGGELDGRVQLPHFFDVVERGMFLNDENGWARWRHKVDLFMAMLADRSRKVVLSTSRAYNDGPETRAEVARQASGLAGYLAEKYGRTPDNTLVLSFVLCRCEKTAVELDEPMARQVAVPILDRDKDVKSDLKIDWTDGIYMGEFKKALGL